VYCYDLCRLRYAGLGLRFAQGRPERLLRGQSAIPNSVSIVSIIISIIIIFLIVDVDVCNRKYRLGVLLVPFPAHVRIRRRGRLRKRRLQREVSGRQPAAEAGGMARRLVRHLRRRVARLSRFQRDAGINQAVNHNF